ncbi:MAG: hypothetical protein Kow0042_15620 [Calditrichia bacterium]
MKSPIVRVFLYLIYLVVITFILAEVLVRIFDPFDIRHYFEMKSCLNVMEMNPQYEYTQKPGFYRKYKNFVLEINSEGFRGKEFSLKKPPGKKRLLLLGDSMVLGWGVPLEDIFPTLIQKKIDSLGWKWEVIPAGVISWNTRNEVEFLKSRGIQYEPDLVVMLVFGNDVIPKLNSYSEVPKEKLFPNLERIKNPPAIRKILFGLARGIVYNSYALTTAMYIFVWKHQNEGLLDYYQADSPAWEDTRLALVSLKEFCRQRNLKLLIVLGLYENQTDPMASTYRETYANFLQQKQFEAAETVVAFDDPHYRNSPMDGHPNRRGHRIIADHLFQILKPYLNPGGIKPSLE